MHECLIDMLEDEIACRMSLRRPEARIYDVKIIETEVPGSIQVKYLKYMVF
ncbi:hypothetical protein ACFCVU_17385 [Peribacillus butanolivorans]|uniref:hypothetical protein n=1 Tax=Peribacillus butanolivorans TaxID=421767 RepID=UPI0035D54118